MVNAANRKELTWWPAELLATNKMQMHMIHRLAAMFAIIDHYTITIVELELFGNLTSSDHQMPKDLNRNENTIGMRHGK